MSHTPRRGALLLLAVCLLAFVPGLFTNPPIDRDEPRFTQASRQMYNSPDASGWIVPMVQDRPRLNKPPLIYWLQAGTAAALTGDIGPNATRDAIWMYRLPSAIAGIVAVFATWRLGRRLGTIAAHRSGANVDSRGHADATGLLAALFVAVSPVISWEARQGRADMVLVGVTTAALLFLWRVFEHRGTWRGVRDAIVLWLLVGIGIMTKGPVTPMVVVLGAIAFSIASREWRWWRTLGPWWGVPLACAVALPWVLLVVREIGFDEYWKTIRAETIGRAGSAAEGHGGFPGYHILLMPLVLGAGSIFAGWGIVRAARGMWRREAELDVSLVWCASMVLPSWIVFEISSTKLPHYTMPLLSVLAIVSAMLVVRVACDGVVVPNAAAWLARAWGVMMGVMAMLPALAATAWVWWSWSDASASARSIGIATIVLCAGAGVFVAHGVIRSTRSRAWLHASVAGVSCGIVLAAGVGVVIPQITIARTSERLVRAMPPIDPTHSRPLACVRGGHEDRPGLPRLEYGYDEDSLIFLTRGRCERLWRQEWKAWAKAHPDGILFLERNVADDDELHQASLRIVDRVLGFNYSKGRFVEVLVVEREP
ncbi:MAG: glycosyltransferase family 39 protein [Phycisphaerales bacterium]|nr:MAG: glycosyltransferase family 39 protein [Phycisphaerales bacterium]